MVEFQIRIYKDDKPKTKGVLSKIIVLPSCEIRSNFLHESVYITNREYIYACNLPRPDSLTQYGRTSKIKTEGCAGRLTIDELSLEQIEIIAFFLDYNVINLENCYSSTVKTKELELWAERVTKLLNNKRPTNAIKQFIINYSSVYFDIVEQL